ncbi:hypothetical protein ALC57_13587 [Trachymyrmex cornetzi]|uniref:Double jelly roll-like domain-containing protein n=1 Tax=Trachymyrmex cornetzi TaxID=471704 RepID=A0A151IZ74_9HYME|nr:hypothetical protein ALC57_13587 [Trachymyrmex cornetzi]
MENHERVERELLEQCGQVATLVECFAWLQRCDECIERLEELCRVKRPRLTFGHRQSVVARIALLAGAKTQLERHFVHVGGGYASGEYASDNEQSLVWREIAAAFESRIVTGVVINSKHIEPRRILEDAGNVVLERVRDATERHGSVKVNTTFNGEFATNDKRANKSITTKNIEIYQYTDLREWYQRHIIEPTLTVDHFAWIKNLSHLVSSQLNRNKNCVKLRFIDSFKFLDTNLDKLGSFLSRDKLKIVHSKFSTLSDEEFELLTCKGVFPYEYVDCIDKLNERCLPPRESFYSLLMGDTVSESDYAHALPGFTWDAMLKYTRVRFELLADIDMIMFTERGIRGGRDYIELNTQFRTRAKNNFEKNLYKLRNNAIFGKTTENVRNHVDVKLISKWDGRYGAEAMIAKPNFHSRSVFAENLTAIEMNKNDQTPTTLVNNCVAFMFDEIRYELNGVEIDRNRNVGITSTLKNYMSLTYDKALIAMNAGWNTRSDTKERYFNFCMPLSMLLGFCENYKRLIVNPRHELILIRARNDNNCLVGNPITESKIELFKVQWRNVKLYLNSTFYPYDDLNLDFGKKRYAVLFDMYSRFHRAYYGIDCFETLLYQNESVKIATVDVRIEFDCKENVPANTTAYCPIIQDRVAQYNPLTNVVRKII